MLCGWLYALPDRWPVQLNTPNNIREYVNRLFVALTCINTHFTSIRYYEFSPYLKESDTFRYKIIWLTLFKELIPVYDEKYTKPIK